MADSNASPRQKMINMMYLVLTALLALNVSAEILKAFHLVEVSMARAGDNIDKKNQESLAAIAKYKSDHPTDPIAIDAEAKAKQAVEVSKEAVKYFNDLKEELIAATGGRKEDSNGDGKQDDEEIVGASNTEIHANMMIVQKRGEEVKKKINDTREKLLALVPADKRAGIKSDLVTPDPPPHEGTKITWESQMFEHTPLAAVNTLLTKTQNDIKNTEAQVLDYFRSNLTGDVIVIDNFKAQVIPTNGTYVSVGSKYAADIFLAAASSKTDATVTVNGREIKSEEGIGKFETNPGSEGEQKFKGVITTKRASGKVEQYPFEFAFTAVKPIAVIAATKMNVVYIGLDNPISVSVPGYAATDISVSLDPASAGQLKPDPKQKGSYLLSLNKTASKVKVVASVKDRGTGATKKMGEQEYRVRMVPDPIPALGTLDVSGNVASAQIRSQNVVRAPLKNFAFEGVNYIPYEFQFVMIPKRGGQPVVEKGNGQMLTSNMQAALSRAVKGDKVIITSIKVKGPDGARQLPTPLVFDIQ